VETAALVGVVEAAVPVPAPVPVLPVVPVPVPVPVPVEEVVTPEVIEEVTGSELAVLKKIV
jgi:hypothetical protein